MARPKPCSLCHGLVCRTWRMRCHVHGAVCRDKQKQRLLELEREVAALSQANKGTRGERDALLQRNATLQARCLLEP